MKVSLKLTKEVDKKPPYFKNITGHLIFDATMGFTRKAIFVAGGHLPDPPQAVTYSNVLSLDTFKTC